MIRSERNSLVRSPLDRTSRIRKLNDRFRTTLIGGEAVITRSIEALGLTALGQILADIRAFTVFDDSNDPYGEHDFGALDSVGERIFWKIDYYDLALVYGSPDPSDPDVTVRVITIMLASDY